MKIDWVDDVVIPVALVLDALVLCAIIAAVTYYTLGG
jgi:hypothetical protein